MQTMSDIIDKTKGTSIFAVLKTHDNDLLQTLVLQILTQYAQ